MSTVQLAPQVKVVCDFCGHALEGGDCEVTMHFEPHEANERCREYGWRVLDDKHMCARCQEERGQEVNE
jgi:primosomal protein N'